ncbi:M24 family metallopeptidase [Halovivax sp.]|uniref:M24 family metallopeptidase n=1 Tax=Halovivax sp. TaxID=1935978 RepID=UPI0025BED22F|nr:M24 family metallopeptidase [Halovivax sp.]
MERRRRLETYLADRDLDAIWFARPNSYAWLTGGSNVVDRGADAGVAAVGFDGDWRVLTDSIEASRIAAEELPEVDAEVETYPWYERELTDAIAARTDGRGAADVEVPGFERIDASSLRQPLTDRDLEDYRELGRETAAAVESVCRDLRADDTEADVAAAVAIALRTREIEAPVVLVGGAQRAGAYRHYTPTDAELGDYALVSVTARRDGLHASCTRTVRFHAPDWLADRHDAAARVEVTALAATRKLATRGGTAGDVFAEIRSAYQQLGFAGEWREHHQGGATGYAGREWIATPNHEAGLTTPMAYAWNPTVAGAKSEDTVLVTNDGFEVLTATGEWPTRSFDAVDRECSLERPVLLGR